MTFKLKFKIAALAIAAAAVPVIVMSTMTMYKKEQVETQIKEKINVLIEDSIQHIASDIYHACVATNTIVENKLDSDMRVATHNLGDYGTFSLSKTENVKWNAVNPADGGKFEIELPKMLLGGKWLGQVYNINEPVPAVDFCKAMMGDSATIFQRINEQGDMMRVATTGDTIYSDGKRGIGTVMMAMGADNKPNPIIADLLAGKKHVGRTKVLGYWALAAYEPIKDMEGKLIGCFGIGVRMSAMKNIAEMIKNTKVGKTGYIAVIGGMGDQRGCYIVSKNGERDGESVLDAKDASGNLFVKEIVEKAVKLRPGEFFFKTYPWLNPGETTPRQKTAAIMYFAPWDWVIMSSTYADDYREINESVVASMTQLLVAVLAGGLVILLAVAALALLIGSRIGTPVEKVSLMAKDIADGDLSAASDKLSSISKAVSSDGTIKTAELSSDETGALIFSIVSMTRNLNSLVGQVQRSIIQLASSATEIAASAKEQEAIVAEFGASTNQIVASSKEISATSLHLVNSMKDVAEVSGRTAGLASAGHSSLGEMESMMNQLAGATGSISSKLSVINEKANNINNVVTAITKVADQTNLLSLNAAIEAEKAGEFGKGFSVVAREVRRLADQTAVATLDITRMVKEMQSAVSSGVMEMDKFSEEVRHGVRETVQISSQLAKIIEDVQSLPPVFNNVIDGMKQQSSGAQQISEAIVQLSDAVRQTSESLREFNQAVAQLNNATQGLQKEVSIFKVK